MNIEMIHKPDIDFSLGGYFGSNVWIKSREGIIRYSFSDYPLFRDDNWDNFRNDIWDKKQLFETGAAGEIRPTEKEWKKFLEVLKITDKWKKKYWDNHICDGTQWELQIYWKLPEGKRKLRRFYGSNEYPADFEIFGKALADLIHFKKLKSKEKFKFWEEEDDFEDMS